MSIISISKFSFQSDVDRLTIDGYNLTKSDHPSDPKKSGFCINYKQNIALIKRDSICTLDNCLVIEICYQIEKYFIAYNYRSQSQVLMNFKISQNILIF